MDEQKKKRIIIGVAIGIAMIFLLGVVIVVSNFFSPSGVGDDGPGQEIYEPSVYYVNRDELNDNLTAIISGIVLSDLDEVILNQEQVDSAPNDNDVSMGLSESTYVTTVSESSFKKIDNEPVFTFEFMVSVSDGRTYTIYVRTDENMGQEYVVSAIKRTDKPSNNYLFINANTEENNDTFIKWATGILKNDSIKTSYYNLKALYETSFY